MCSTGWQRASPAVYQAVSEYQPLILFTYMQKLLPEYHLEFYKRPALEDGGMKHSCKTLIILPEGIIQLSKLYLYMKT